MTGQSTECEAEWMMAEDPLFMLYTRYAVHKVTEAGLALT